MRRVLLASMVALAGTTATAHAQPTTLDAAVEAHDSGEFERARELLSTAREGALSRADLVRLLRYDALTAQALGDDAAVEAATLRLATLDPEAFDERAPPPVRRRMEAALERTAGDRVRVDIEHRQTADGVRVRARVRGDLGGLTERIELRARADGGPWTDPAETATLAGASTDSIEVAARAVGPGGATLATAGTQADPLRLTAPLRDGPAPRPTPEPTPEESDDTVLHVLLVVGAIVVVGAAVGIGAGVAASDGGGGAAVIQWGGPPLIEW